MTILDMILKPAGDPVDLHVGDETCEGCGEPLAEGGEDLAGVIGEDDQGLPGFVLYHESCLMKAVLL